MTAHFSLPPVCRKEVFRYAGMHTATPEVSALLEDALAEIQTLTQGKVCWQEFPLSIQGDAVELGFGSISAPALGRHLRGCHRAVVFAATIGMHLDQKILRYGKTAPAKALLLQAIGAERIEALCDVFQDSIREDAAARGYTITSRFSPGYGDFPLTFQKDLFRVLDCSRKIGLTLNDSLLMSPSKSVTAVIGIGIAEETNQSGCARCEKNDCIHRRRL